MENREAIVDNVPTHSWKCQDCGSTLSRYRWQGDIMCCECDALYNAFGQRLRDDYYGNPSVRDDDIDDLEGYERQYHDW